MMLSNNHGNSIQSYSLDQFFQDVFAGQYQVLSIDLEKNGFRIASLQKQLYKGNNIQHPILHAELEDIVEKKHLKFNGKSWTRFNIMLVSFLDYCRDVNPWSLWDSCDLIFQVYQDFNNCLINDSYPLDPLVPVFREMTDYIIPIALRLDENYLSAGTKKYQFLSFSSSVISKLFNSIKPSRLMDDNVIPSNHSSKFPEKQKILLYLVNKLNNIYFRIDSPQLCFNVFKNFKPKSMISRFSQYPIKEQIEFRYLLGRYYIINGRVINAFVQLNHSYKLLIALCETAQMDRNGQVQRNLLRILRYLIPTGLLIGKVPNFYLISQIDPLLSEKYSSLSQYVRSGYINGLNNWLRNNERELCDRHLLLILLEKLPMICYRNLMRSIIRQCVIPYNSGKIPYSLVHCAMAISIKDTPLESQQTIDVYNGIHFSKNVENVLVTLINLGFLRGNCFPQLKVCVVKKTTSINEILPSVEDRILTSFALHNEDSWLDD